MRLIWSASCLSLLFYSRNESRPDEVFLFETKLWSMGFDETSSIDDISKLDEFVFINWSYILSVSVFFWIEYILWLIISWVWALNMCHSRHWFQMLWHHFFISNYRMWLHFNSWYRTDKLTLSQWLFYNMMYC